MKRIYYIFHTKLKMSSSSTSAILQRIIQQYLNQDINNSNLPPLNRNHSINERDPFSLNHIIQMMNRYHTIIEEYQNTFRLIISMYSLEQTLQRQQTEYHNPISQTLPRRNPIFNPLNANTTTHTNNNIQTSQRHTSTEPGSETQTVSFVDVVVEIDEPFENLTQTLLGNDGNQNIQNLVSNIFQDENFRNNIIQNTGITPSTNMQWFTSFINAPITSQENTGLTNEQIENCTNRIVYQNNTTELLSHTCPITMEDFREGDTILKLTECSHTFREMDLLRWFVTHSTCPVCRHSYQDSPLNN